MSEDKRSKLGRVWPDEKGKGDRIRHNLTWHGLYPVGCIDENHGDRFTRKCNKTELINNRKMLHEMVDLLDAEDLRAVKDVCRLLIGEPNKTFYKHAAAYSDWYWKTFVEPTLKVEETVG
jgi:hypothetical protein